MMEKITIRVTEKEKDQIQKTAKSVGKSVSAYIGDVALNVCNFDFSARDEVNEHVHEISSLRNSINQLIYTIQKTGDYYPSELETIHDLMVEVLESEKKFFSLMEKDIADKKKELKKEINKVVRERLETIEKGGEKGD